MATRRFHDIEYPIPGVDTAIKSLRPNARYALKASGGIEFTGWECDDGTEPPTQEEIEEEVRREQVIYDYYGYERQRHYNFPSGEDQLDMLYHDIKNGNIENGSWIKAIDEVKEAFPKPEGPVPH